MFWTISAGNYYILSDDHFGDKRNFYEIKNGIWSRRWDGIEWNSVIKSLRWIAKKDPPDKIVLTIKTQIFLTAKVIKQLETIAPLELFGG